MTKILVVTSFSEDGYKLYGKDFISSWKNNWPSEVNLLVYHHSNFKGTTWAPDFKDEGNISYRNLDLIQELGSFKEQGAKLIESKTGQPYNTSTAPWQLDIVKFTNKVFALANANADLSRTYDWIVWLDADTITKKPVSIGRLTHWLDKGADIVHLGRTATSYSETSFIGFQSRKGLGGACLFIDDLIWFYLSGEFQYFVEWHDGFIFERLLNFVKRHHLKTKNLSRHVHGTLAAFSNSELGFYMEHKKGNLKYGKDVKPHSNNGKVPFIVNPKDCVPQKEIKENIIKNLKYIKKWVQTCKTTDKEAIFVSGGPSAKEYLKEIKRKQLEEGAVVFSVKHSYPTLMEYGIRPDYCVIIDPRSIEGVSTHGKNRRGLFDKVHPDTTFLVSSMAHHTIAPFFAEEKNAKVVGWHAATGELMSILPNVGMDLKYKKAITIGTCSAIRGLSLVKLLGFNKVTLVGYDSSLPDKPENPKEMLESGQQKYFLVSLQEETGVQITGVSDPSLPLTKTEQRFWTTGELVALYQDFINIIPLLEEDRLDPLVVDVLSPSNTLIGYGWYLYKSLTARKRDEYRLERQGSTVAHTDLAYTPNVKMIFNPDFDVV